jgi:N-acetylglutamate synthase-like GNAT family acetyltransferase
MPHPTAAVADAATAKIFGTLWGMSDARGTVLSARNLPVAEWSIRPAQKRDWRPVRMLLPRSVHMGCGCAVLVATDRAGRIVGAAALSPRTRNDPAVGSLCDVHVVPPWRRKGIARALLDHVARLVRSRGGEALYAWEPVSPDSEQAAAWIALGFDHSSSFHRTHVDIGPALEQLEPYERRMRKRKWIPEGAAVAPLAEADLAKVAELNVNHLGGTTIDLLRNLTGETPEAYDPNLSVVVTLDGKMLGCAVLRVIEPGVARIEANTIDPSVRGRWANVLLRIQGARTALENGLKTVVFDTREVHADTRSVADKLGGKTVRMIEPYRLLNVVKASPFR